MFTHTARDDAALLYRHLYKHEDITAQTRLVPHAVFTDPEVETARQRGEVGLPGG